ncbi:MAG: HesB/IscA family protein [Planctomycetota bacterium]|jgi:iron-sulfur cluster assembly protein
MVTITEKAADKVRQLISSKDGMQDPGLRVRVVAGGCSGLSYQLDLDDGANPDDRTYENHGVKVFVDGKSDLYLANVEIDWQESLMGASFTFKNPDAQGSCGCGESFYA